jgi:3-oxoadipate enol-lactonase
LDTSTELVTTPSFTTEVCRQGDGPTLLLIQGGGTGKNAWSALVDRLAPQIRCVTYDNRGVGRAADVGDELSVESMADDAAELIETLGEGPVHVCGVSMGGFIAMRLAQRRPDLVHSLGLHATSARLNRRTHETGEFRLRLLDLGLEEFPQLLREFLRLWAAGPDGLLAELPRDVVNHGAFNRHNYVAHVRAIRNHDMSDDDLAAISAPTLITAGTDDILVPMADSRRLHRAIPGSKLVTLDGAGHVYYFEEAELLAALQGGWIAQHA